MTNDRFRREFSKGAALGDRKHPEGKAFEKSLVWKMSTWMIQTSMHTTPEKRTGLFGGHDSGGSGELGQAGCGGYRASQRGK